MKPTLKPAQAALLATLLGWTFIPASFAAQHKIDPTGTWTWTIPVGNGNEIHRSVDFKWKGDKLTGTTHTQRDTEPKPLDAVSLQDHQISFQYTVDFRGGSFSPKYVGKIKGDKIAGQIIMEFNGQKTKRDWQAKRRLDVTGTWKYSFTTRSGRTFSPTLKLKQEGTKLTGELVFRRNRQLPISEGTVQNGKVSFTIRRERNGRTITATYTGKLAGDIIKGQIKATRGDNEQVNEFEAKRQRE